LVDVGGEISSLGEEGVKRFSILEINDVDALGVRLFHVSSCAHLFHLTVEPDGCEVVIATSLRVVLPGSSSVSRKV
jgi:hypothetical protein